MSWLCSDHASGRMSHNISFQTSPGVPLQVCKRPLQIRSGLFASLPHSSDARPFFTHLTSLITHMKFDHEVEYLPLDKRGQEPPQKRGFLKRLLDCLSITRVYSDRSSSHSSSGGEVEEEDVIEF